MQNRRTRHDLIVTSAPGCPDHAGAKHPRRVGYLPSTPKSYITTVAPRAEPTIVVVAMNAHPPVLKPPDGTTLYA
jgi:hypothetical protein